MSSPATVSEYGKFIDLQSYTAAAPAKSGSIYLSGAAGSELVRTNVGLSAAGNVTAVGSFIIGSADMSEADLEKLDGITNGTVAASKAVVVDANKDASGFRHVTSTGNVTAGGSFVIGSADMDETDLEKLDGITNGTAAANKAVVLDASKNIATLGTVGCGAITSTGASTMGSLSVGAVSSSADLHAVGAATFSSTVAASGSITAGTSFIIGSADLNETDLEKLDGITDGTAAANKALVLDSNKDASGLRNLTMTGDMTAGTVTMTGFTVDADGDVALKSLAVDDGSTIGCDSDTDLMTLSDGALAVNGTLSADTSFTLDTTTLDATELGYLDSVVAGTAAASKALVLDANKAVGTITHLTATYAKIDQLDVNTINSVTTTASDLEVSDRRIVAALSASSANADGGGLRIGGGASSAGHAAMLWSHSDSALALSVGSTDIAFVHGSGFDPGADNSFDLGGASNEWRNLYIDGQAFIDQLGEALDANSQNITGVGTFSAAGATVTSLSVSDGNITNVGDIALDTISADGNDFDLVLTDNRSAAMQIREGSNVYLQFETTNGGEGIFAKKEFEFQAGANMDDDQKFKFATDQSDSGASGSLGYISASDVFEISGSGANGIRMSGSLSLTGGGGVTYGIEAGQVSFAAAAVTSLSVTDGNITNVGNIALDSISADGTDIDISLTDNSSTALEIKQGGNNYMVFDTADSGGELIDVYKEMELRAGAIVRDDQSVVFGTDDDSSIQFVSAANVLRFAGGTQGLHFNDLVKVGADGSGKDVSFFGATSNELMKYTAADHTLTFVGSGGGSAYLTLGGDATTEFAVDVAEGSNNQNKIRASAFVTYSDERLKTDVAPMQNGLETVNNLKAVNFTWKKDGTRDFGFMAQQLKQVVPQAVHGSEETMLGVDYGRLSAILVSAIQEQSAQIASLKKQLENK